MVSGLRLIVGNWQNAVGNPEAIAGRRIYKSFIFIGCHSMVIGCLTKSLMFDRSSQLVSTWWAQYGTEKLLLRTLGYSALSLTLDIKRETLNALLNLA